MRRRMNLYVFAGIVFLLICANADAGMSERAKLVASDGNGSALFGRTVSISGDYAIVGAIGDKEKGADAGAAYIFKRDGKTWSEQVKLTALDGGKGDVFGTSVAISGDYAIVGAIGDDGKGKDSGAAYIFRRDGEIWKEQAKLVASDIVTDDRFGDGVSISGDYAIIGACGDDDKGDFSGAAYIFKRDGEKWKEQIKLVAEDGEENDFFGRYISISGDYVIAGVYLDDDNGNASGSAYIFKRKPKSWFKPERWEKQAKLLASDGDYGDYFGCSVSISDDYAVVGAYYDGDEGKERSGAAYIFKRDGKSWSEQAKLIASDGAAEDYFGQAVSISGDYVIAGAFGDDDKKKYSGSAYIFERKDGTWSEQAKIFASDGGKNDYFGQSVYICGDYAIAGAPGDGDKGENSGSAYIFGRNN